MIASQPIKKRREDEEDEGASSIINAVQPVVSGGNKAVSNLNELQEPVLSKERRQLYSQAQQNINQSTPQRPNFNYGGSSDIFGGIQNIAQGFSNYQQYKDQKQAQIRLQELQEKQLEEEERIRNSFSYRHPYVYAGLKGVGSALMHGATAGAVSLLSPSLSRKFNARGGNQAIYKGLQSNPQAQAINKRLKINNFIFNDIINKGFDNNNAIKVKQNNMVQMLKSPHFNGKITLGDKVGKPLVINIKDLTSSMPKIIDFVEKGYERHYENLAIYNKINISGAEQLKQQIKQSLLRAAQQVKTHSQGEQIEKRMLKLFDEAKLNTVEEGINLARELNAFARAGYTENATKTFKKAHKMVLSKIAKTLENKKKGIGRKFLKDIETGDRFYASAKTLEKVMRNPKELAISILNSPNVLKDMGSVFDILGLKYIGDSQGLKKSKPTELFTRASMLSAIQNRMENDIDANNLSSILSEVKQYSSKDKGFKELNDIYIALRLNNQIKGRSESVKGFDNQTRAIMFHTINSSLQGIFQDMGLGSLGSTIAMAYMGSEGGGKYEVANEIMNNFGPDEIKAIIEITENSLGSTPIPSTTKEIIFDFVNTIKDAYKETFGKNR